MSQSLGYIIFISNCGFPDQWPAISVVSVAACLLPSMVAGRENGNFLAEHPSLILATRISGRLPHTQDGARR